MNEEQLERLRKLSRDELQKLSRAGLDAMPGAKLRKQDEANKYANVAITLFAMVLFAMVGSAFWNIFEEVRAAKVARELRSVEAQNFDNLSPTDAKLTASSSSTLSTEEKLSAVYDALEIQYDDRMLREDARQVEILAREQGMTIDQSVVIWSTQR